MEERRAVPPVPPTPRIESPSGTASLPKTFIVAVVTVTSDAGTCTASFPDEDKLHHFHLAVSPDEGYYQSGRFQFEIDVPEAYNMVPPKVRCLTRIWHPNITENGEICLSLLREHSIDGTGWAPTRTLKDVVWGLNSLFTDLLNFDDPLNIDAAEHHLRDKGFTETALPSRHLAYAIIDVELMWEWLNGNGNLPLSKSNIHDVSIRQAPRLIGLKRLPPISPFVLFRRFLYRASALLHSVIYQHISVKKCSDNGFILLQ
ncbi:hypothetical protein F2P81_020940 [Scophthalmus maximus]|uniref:E2 NEDD8-conjugating enzyme n=1 Tax=Scophthalmus maximus TaxID=52904 RepID=A0A6A4RVY1_SCOMX|nr:hypothetical protein F2P81_020940 [Scophthalmus maximus]